MYSISKIVTHSDRLLYMAFVVHVSFVFTHKANMNCGYTSLLDS